MAFKHGIYTREVPTSLIAPVQIDGGLPVVVGTAPIHLASDEDGLSNVNKPKLIYNHAEAVSYFGDSDDWDKYTLCEFIYSQFALYGMSPCVLINVLDPAKHKETVTDKEFVIVDGSVDLGTEILISSVEAADFEEAGEDEETGSRLVYKLNEDYSLGYDGEGNLILDAVAGGKL